MDEPTSARSPCALRAVIESTFGERLFDRPTFYNNPGGLRFALSSGGSTVDCFLSAFRTAKVICEDILPPGQDFTVCLAICLPPSILAGRGVLRRLAQAGIVIPRARSTWMRPPEDPESVWVTRCIAFHVERRLLDNLLWCALASDLAIEPNPRCEAIYLMDLARAVCVHPYDDRGMDVVGGNHELLRDLHARHGRHLLDHDRKTMAATFGA